MDGQRVTQWADLGGGSSSKKVPATKPSVPKPASKYTPVAFQEQPVSTSASKVQSAVTTAAPAITPAMQKNIAAAAAVGAVGNSVNSPNTSSSVSTTKYQDSSLSPYYSQLSAFGTSGNTSSVTHVTSPVSTKPTCGDGKKANYIFFTTGKDADFSNQAKYQYKQFKSKGEDATMVKVDTLKEFEQAWKGLPNSLNHLIIISHSNGTALILQHNSKTEALSVDGLNSDYKKIGNITELSRKNIDILEIIACNSGNLTLADIDDGNVAQAFLKIDGIDTVVAYDGNVGFGDNSFWGQMQKMFNQEAWEENLYPRRSKDQTSFNNIITRNNATEREPAGKVLYTADGSHETQGWD